MDACWLFYIGGNLFRRRIMAAASLLTLLDDIASVLDDVAILSKVAAKKTAGVLGDDLALNAEQVSGVRAERELPVVWAVAKGSLLNKLILVPSALVISYFAPWMVMYLLIIGGLYLCFEGVEKLIHKFTASTREDEQAHSEKLKALADPSINLVELEKQKIKGAIRTDFVLSAEIIVIILGTVQTESFTTQITVLSLLSFLFTVGVYGFVALIVKIDDLGLYLLRKSESGNFDKIQLLTGRALLRFAPILMKTLTIVGTAAMFLVGGGIIAHGVPFLHHFVEQSVDVISVFPTFGSIVGSLTGIALNAAIGILSGLLVVLVFSTVEKLKQIKK
ncbi:MAG: putative DNA repair protein MutK [Gammaproteobacteria bacterium]|jgi:predicted DNA repair protein MutK